VAQAIDGAIATVGRMEVEPGAVNVVPGLARCTLDARCSGDGLDALCAAALAAADEASAVHGCTVEYEPTWASQRVAFDPRVLAAIEEVAPLPHLESWGGHDAGVLAEAGVPAAMLFVRSLAGGVSHHPDEHTSAEDVAAAVDVLTRALARLAA
jgi:N-carbamoyl-L-amino-acid hydrolase